MASLDLVDVAVSHEGRPLLDAVNLSVPDGERVALLGPSGAGKTTLLRAIAGAHPLDRGAILLDGVDISEMKEAERDITLLVQSASLFRHRRVAGNLSFPLELRSVPRADINERVRAQARAFALDELLDRRITTLSAGETAEVALARAMIRRSALLLMDEPFARIGPAQRASVIQDVIEMQTGFGSTMVVATNDWRGAATIAPTLAVLASGGLVQTGTSRDLVERPATLDVAWLVVDGTLNLLPGRLERDAGQVAVHARDFTLATRQSAVAEHAPGPVQVAIRAQDLRVIDLPSARSVAGHVVHHTFLGDHVDLTVATEDAQLIVRCARPVPPVGARLHVAVEPDSVHLFAPDGTALAHGV